jgi:tetratricopeptide repeat protein
MSFILANVIVLVLAASLSWWLSGYDSRVTGENEKEDRIRRGIRCGATLLLVEPAFSGLWRYWRYDDRAAGVLYLMTSLPLAIIWCSCISELLARGFHWLIDPEDKREFDPGKGARDLDTIASLIKNGRKEEAIQLCQTLKESGDASVLAMEVMLEHLGVPQTGDRKPKPLIQAYRLREEGKFNETEMILKALLAEHPSNADAALMLMRLYAQDLHRSDKAMEILRSLEQQPHISSGPIEFARRSIHEWGQGKAKAEEEAAAPPESVEELLACGYFGTAVEVLEAKTKEQPQDFDSWLKLAEVHAKYCGNIRPAEKIIQQIETNPAFTAEQGQTAKSKLSEWRNVRLRK